MDLATVTMSGAIKEITVERGRDLRGYQLFVFGGGGPLFGAGMLMAEARRDTARTFLKQLSPEALGTARAQMRTMEDELRASMATEFDVSRIAYIYEADMNYVGQSHTARIQLTADLTPAKVQSAFEATYRARYGHLNEETPIAFVVLRVGGLVPTLRPTLEEVGAAAKVGGTASPRTFRPVYFAKSGRRLKTPVYRRTELPVGFTIEGPAIVEEYSATTVVTPGDTLVVGGLGELRISCAAVDGKGEATHG